ncbi:AMP-binding protein [Pseudoalteromonas luteoviolacea]|uniref:AMP-dependent synthetase/ligase domain-containing protein n=1 Tax=Pseudoalteromonas luteoviolacea S4054 TaxID=1129367 RepID=A0A0F6A6L9_9GAMM|nr:AMP-binding protein [Pseudoalteromonas luteoviolacea]AOT08868.1 hypothetical protein S4054249_13825 [Pseudoalteromonas luteoviolacea]AOT13781.1 hypothetical protein S40542_13795 [Pseudoalteromonas luteoviolacea]AOT18695.1 hypothetical protein S4054_13800 [Pseudoalteromonas luteoviolacea]KKE81773.1 hypothetical protein N479_21320 [Pseudoalteromonas luteoviolacea S4054]KZN67993.1 hypothetical protein N481_23420 [Pseudoalteromonas luteoviolacea S4047-1]
MKDFEDLINQVRRQIIISVELEESEIAQLSNDDDLLGSPLFLDSVDLLQIYADCQRKFSVVFNNADYEGTHTVRSIVTRTISAKATKNANTDSALFYSSDGNRYSDAEFKQHIAQLITALQSAGLDKTKPLRVLDVDPVKMMMVMVAAVLSGHKPLLSAQPQGENAVSFADLASKQGEAPSLPDSYTIYQQLATLSQKAVIFFETSGSTGVPVRIEKSLASMVQEVEALTTLFDFSVLDLIDAYVSPVHMYGFIWSFLLPLKLETPVMYQSNTLLRPVSETVSHVMAVSVPSIWQSLSGALTAQYRYIVNSGGKFGEQRDVQFAKLVQSKLPELQGIDVLGSTETGAIAYRMIGQDNIQTYQLLPTVSLQPSDDGHLIYSDFLPLGVECAPLDDKIELLANNKILHLGRKDNVFKFKGKRYSLKAIEDKLSQLFSGHDLRVYFIDQAHNVRGGELIAFVAKASSHFDITDEVRALFQDLPIPKIEFIDELPTNAMGKVTLQGLQEKVRNARV